MSIRLAVKENRLSDPGRVTTRMYEDYLYKLGRGWVCEQGGAIIGFSYADSTDGSIWALFVLPECEGRGAGNGLLQLAVDWLFAQGWDELKLGTAAGTRANQVIFITDGWHNGLSSRADRLPDETAKIENLARDIASNARIRCIALDELNLNNGWRMLNW